MSFKYEPNRVKVDKDRIRYDDQKAYKSSQCAGKGSFIMGFDQKKFSEGLQNIDWTK